jgi:hypothetical protein
MFGSGLFDEKNRGLKTLFQILCKGTVSRDFRPSVQIHGDKTVLHTVWFRIRGDNRFENRQNRI